jgi:hypothetical protein
MANEEYGFGVSRIGVVGVGDEWFYRSNGRRIIRPVHIVVTWHVGLNDPVTIAWEIRSQQGQLRGQRVRYRFVHDKNDLATILDRRCLDAARHEIRVLPVYPIFIALPDG